MQEIAIKIIKVYQYFSKTVLKYSPGPLLMPSMCRFYPSCSDYTIDAISKHGFFKGSVKGLLRILKCNPLASG